MAQVFFFFSSNLIVTGFHPQAESPFFLLRNIWKTKAFPVIQRAGESDAPDSDKDFYATEGL